MTLFSRLSPYGQANEHHPLFQLEARRVYWGESADHLRLYSLAFMTKIVSALLGIWLFISICQFSQDAGGYADKSDNWTIIGLVAGVGLLAGFALDYVSLVVSLNSINGEFIQGRWDLLRLTLLRADGVVAAKHAAAQVRAWRAILIVLSVRIAVVLMIVIQLVMTVWSYYSRQGANDLVNDLRLTLGQALLPTLAVATIYLLEPLWRVRAMTAMGLAISAQTTNSLSTMLMSVSAVLAVWILELLVVMCAGVGIWLLATPVLILSGGNVSYSLLPSMCASVAIGGILTASVFGFYTALQSWCLRRVLRRLIAG